ncbi:hypothetical protein KY359_04040 [Candidatus Woesearchaeota archaeon]|nr:hypothetical protein [Candidatus Woesearchaeota archaeon]
MLEMGDMTRNERYVIFFIFLAVYAGLAIFNFIVKSQWFFDNLVAIAFLLFMFAISGWLLLTKSGFLMFNAALLLHNMGSFGWYARTFDGFAYDNIVHFFGAVVAAWIIFNFVASKLHIRKHHRVRNTVVDEHKVVFIFLVVASVAMLGTIVEIVEFGGFVLLGPGEGLFFTGSGDGGYSTDDFELQYRDTMNDILVNTFGSIVGVLMFYKMRYKKGDWVGSRG